jgi:hypothetical protein
MRWGWFRTSIACGLDEECLPPCSLVFASRSDG